MTDKPDGAIACLGWGSLVWDPRDLPVRGRWHGDGPLLPLEFVRESGAKAKGERGDRITLVICADAPRARSYWTLLDVPDLESARQRLARREGMKGQEAVGFWDRAGNGGSGQEAATIASWAVAHNLSGVVWTDLSCKFDGGSVKPTIEQVLAFLNGLDDERKALAEGYVRQARAQIDTPYRRIVATERSAWAIRDQPGCSQRPPELSHAVAQPVRKNATVVVAVTALNPILFIDASCVMGAEHLRGSNKRSMRDVDILLTIEEDQLCAPSSGLPGDAAGSLCNRRCKITLRIFPRSKKVPQTSNPARKFAISIGALPPSVTVDTMR